MLQFRADGAFSGKLAIHSDNSILGLGTIQPLQ
jgi:hypothetical protein